ncbi:uncharacterized protein LOC106161315 isoform X3 [Lingula anatina]|uniref:Uncharacterized protein LOC106161315 isoform X3 n=1 Tax=Lingula anatina TaxID=7574 RepID=A0A1S3I5Y2_LINAN|nr:uncharacterized protein LOC106161315 isoform X3 [Lingula anatina]|eukprot:XP_013393685.1 uncharacterized protein LOC106161315 isoform X3 [Lingula anatina]
MSIIDIEIKKLLDMKVIIPVNSEAGQILSPIFLRQKENGEYRLILNLKKLNRFIPYQHFKMETFEKTLPLITKNVKMGSVDIRHAYYSIKLADEQQKFFRFQWRDKIYQYTCLPNGVSEGPRLFTKLLKPVFGKLRSLGYVSSGYIDDSLIIGCDDLECTENLNATVTLLSKLGFIINEDKSVLRPTSKLKFLGNVIDSDKMIVTLPLDRQEKIISACEELYNVSKAPIRQVARVIGLLVASFSAVDYGKLYYRKLERAKIKALQESKGNYDAPMIISNSMRSDLIWWIVNLKSQHRVIARPNPSETLHTDASTLGWGASYKNNNIGGRWTDVEAYWETVCRKSDRTEPRESL